MRQFYWCSNTLLQNLRCTDGDSHLAVHLHQRFWHILLLTWPSPPWNFSLLIAFGHTQGLVISHAHWMQISWVSLFTSSLNPLLWKQETGSIHVFQTRSHQGSLQPSPCLLNHPSTPVLSLCIIISSSLIRPPTFEGLTKGASVGYLTI